MNEKIIILPLILFQVVVVDVHFNNEAIAGVATSLSLIFGRVIVHLGLVLRHVVHTAVDFREFQQDFFLLAIQTSDVCALLLR